MLKTKEATRGIRLRGVDDAEHDNGDITKVSHGDVARVKDNGARLVYDDVDGCDYVTHLDDDIVCQ